MGDFWGFQEAWLSLVASIFDMAIYPTLFVAYLERLFPWFAAGHRGSDGRPGGRRRLRRAQYRRHPRRGNHVIVVVCGALRSLRRVHRARRPSSRRACRSAVHRSDNSQVGVFGGLLVAMWNYMGWDNASTVAAEVEHPQPHLSARHDRRSAAGDGQLHHPIGGHVGDPADARSVGNRLVGRRRRHARRTGVACGTGDRRHDQAFGMFNALVMSYSRLPLAMAQDGLLPPVFARLHPRTRAPWVAILVLAAGWALCLGLGFERLVTLDVLIYGLSLLLEFIALVVLRLRQPHLPRPFRVPGGIFGAILIGVVPMLLLAFSVVYGDHEQVLGMNSYLFGLLLVVAGFLAYAVDIRLRPARGKRLAKESK